MQAFQEALFTPLFSFLVLICIYTVGEFISRKTKGLLPMGFFAAIIYITCFVSGVFPRTTPANTGMSVVINGFGTLLIVTHLGSTIDFKQLLEEWKTILICLAGFLGILALCIFVGIPLFGRDYAMTAVAPISGGIVAATITAEAATAAGRPEMGAFAFLVTSMQGLVGMPIAAFFLKRYTDKLRAAGMHLVPLVAPDSEDAKPKKRLFKPMKPEANTWMVKTAKLSIVAWIGYLVATYVLQGALSAAVVVLFAGILFHELGFLDDDILTKAGIFNFLMLCLYTNGPVNYSVLDFDEVKALFIPLVGLLVLGAVGIIILAFIVGKLLKVDMNLAIACGLAALFGFPATMILTNDAVNGTGLPEDQKDNLRVRIMPKMIVAGFTTVTIASVIFAGILAPFIFPS